MVHVLLVFVAEACHRCELSEAIRIEVSVGCRECAAVYLVVPAVLPVGLHGELWVDADLPLVLARLVPCLGRELLELVQGLLQHHVLARVELHVVLGLVQIGRRGVCFGV